MNKILSQALKKAVSEYSPDVKEVSKGNRPDLFSLSTETELFQNDKGIICLLYTSPSPRDRTRSRMPSSA